PAAARGPRTVPDRGGRLMGPSEHAGLAASLASLPGMGPARLAALVAAHGFAGAWDQGRSGRVPTADAVLRTLGTSPEQLVATWRDAARALDPAEVFAAHRRAGIDVVPLGTDRYPSALAADLEPPAVVFARGDLS